MPLHAVALPATADRTVVRFAMKDGCKTVTVVVANPALEEIDAMHQGRAHASSGSSSTVRRSSNSRAPSTTEGTSSKTAPSTSERSIFLLTARSERSYNAHVPRPGITPV